MVVLTEQIEIPASYEKLKAWTANFEEEVVPKLIKYYKQNSK